MAAQLDIKERFGVGCLTLFGLPFAVVGIIAAVWMGRIVFGWLGARGWEETPATLTSVNLETHDGSDGGSTHRAVASYEYEFAGQHYTGSRVGFYHGADNIGRWQRRVYDELNGKFQRHETVPCYVNPQHPVEAVLYRDMRWEMVGFMSIFAFAFGVAGFAIIIGAWRGSSSLRQRAALKEQFANEPWRWRPEWQSGNIQPTSKSQMLGAILFATLWNAISFPIGFLMWPELTEKGNRVALIGFVFPLAGIGLIVWAVRCVIRWYKFGSSSFQMAAVPGVLGGRVAGAVIVPRSVAPANGFEVTLCCVQKVVTGSGKNRNVSERSLWQDARVMKAESMRSAPASQAIPVLFAAPYEMPESSIETSDDQVTWRLEVRADIPGVDYLVQFEVPVFKTAASAPGFKVDEAAVQPYEVKPDVAHALQDAGLTISKRADGLTVVFPKMPSPGQAAVGAVVFAVWTVITVVLWKSKAPMIFPIVFSLFDLLMFCGVLYSFFGSARIEVERGAITMTTLLFGWGRPVHFEHDEIAAVEFLAATQQQGTTQVHGVQIRSKSGKVRMAGAALRTQLQATALADLLRESLKL